MRAHLMTNPVLSLFAMLAVLAVCGSGCSSRSQPLSPDAGGTERDGSGLSADAVTTRVPWRFVSADDTDDAQPTVSLALASITDDEATLVVRGRQLPEVVGLAFRLDLGGDAELTRAEAGQVWAAASAETVEQIKQREDQVWGGIALVGQQNPGRVAAVSTTELATLTLRLGRGAKQVLSFLVPHSRVLQPSEVIAARWFGGRFER